MSLQAKTILNLIAGAFAGLLAWALTDLTGWFPFLKTQAVIYANDPLFLLYGAIFGLMLGILLALVDSLTLDSRKRVGIALGLGAGLGFIGGAVGLSFAQTFYGFLAPGGVDTSGSPITFFQRLFARAVGYAIVGGIIGAAQGASRRSWILVRQGAFGGVVGGALGGIAFQITATLLNTAVLARLVALAAIGGLIGFFIGLVQDLFKQAWIRVVLGRNEGKEYLLTNPITTIGRSELSDIGLYGDPQIAPTHAVIEAIPAQKRHRLRHVADSAGKGGPYPPTFINGQPITAEQWLTDGDSIQLGKRTLLFQEKATRGASPIPAGPSFAMGAAHMPDPVAQPNPAAAPPARFIGQELTEVLPASMGGGQQYGDNGSATVVMPVGGGGIGTRLSCQAGPYSGQTFLLSHESLVIGRATDCDIPLAADTLISRKQAIITYSGGRHHLQDAGSSNGTMVNGNRVAVDHVLSSGDVIQIGDTRLRYE